MHLLKPSYRTLIITHARFFCSFQLEIMLDFKYLFAYVLFLISKLLFTPAITFFIKQLKKKRSDIPISFGKLTTQAQALD